MAAGPTTKLIVDAPALVPLGAEDMETSGRDHGLLVLLAIGFDFVENFLLSRVCQRVVLIENALEEEVSITAEENVRSAAGHIGGDGHGAFATGLGDDFRFFLVKLGVQHVVLDAIAAQVARQTLRFLDGNGADEDWLSALDAVAARKDVDPQRIGIWGSSYSGGQVLVVGAERPQQVKAVSAQVPFVSGLSSGLQFPIKYQPMATWYALRDLMRGDDEEPVYVPIIAPDAFAALICPECNEGYKKLVPAGQVLSENKVAARVFLSLPFWFPGDSAPRIKAPTLVVAAEKDGLIPVGKVREVAKSVPNGEYVELPGADHFSPYTGPVFEQVVARQTAFFVKHLQP